MAVLLGRWRFPHSAPPDAAEVAEALRWATGLRLYWRPDGVLNVPLLGEQLSGWDTEGNILSVQGSLPAHPYLWEHLDAVMEARGGDQVGKAAATYPSLRVRWDALSPRNRWLLRLPPVLTFRPLDRFLREGGR